MKEENHLISKFEKYYISKTKYSWSVEEYKMLLDYYLEENYDKEKSLYLIKNAIKDYPDIIMFKVAMSKYYMKQKEYEKALKVISVENVTEDREIDGQLSLIRGELNYQLKKYDTALYWFLHAMKIHKNAKFYYNIGKCYYANNEYKNAMKYFKEFFANYPDCEYVLYNMNDCWNKLGESNKAVEFLEEYIYKKKHSYSIIAWFIIALNYMNINEIDKAVDAFNYSIAINPVNSSAYFNLGNLYSHKREYSKAIEMYNKTLELEGEKYLTILYIAQCQYYLHEYGSAYRNFKKCIDLKKDCAEAYCWLAEMDYSVFELNKALRYINKAILYDDKQADYYALRGDILTLLERYDDAEDNFIKSVEMCPDDIDNIVDMAIFFINKSKPQKATPYLINAIAGNPQEAKLYYLLSLCDYFSGNKQEAYVNFIKGLEINRDFLDYIKKVYPEFMKDAGIKKILKEKK